LVSNALFFVCFALPFRIGDCGAWAVEDEDNRRDDRFGFVAAGGLGLVVSKVSPFPLPLL